jgi:hypothetical protein
MLPEAAVELAVVQAVHVAAPGPSAGETWSIIGAFRKRDFSSRLPACS